MKPPNYHQYGVVARPMDADLISANPVLALVASLVASLQNDLVSGIQRGWIEVGAWKITNCMTPVLRARAALDTDRSLNHQQRHNKRTRCNDTLAEMEAARDACFALHDGRLEYLVEILNLCANGTVDFAPDLFKRRAIALAANPLAFCQDERTSKLRASEIQIRRTAATF